MPCAETYQVSYILDTVLVRLLDNPDRKFIYVETGFFERWWIQQSASKQADMKKVVANGQMEFINGARAPCRTWRRVHRA